MRRPSFLLALWKLGVRTKPQLEFFAAGVSRWCRAALEMP
jgi:hypothetical protein